MTTSMLHTPILRPVRQTAIATVVFLFTTTAECKPTSAELINPQKILVQLECTRDVELGVSLRDSSGKVLLEWRSRERFPLTSTVKALQCARVYDLALGNNLAAIGSVANVAHSPVYGLATPETLISLKQACRAALSQSDNRAANFIFRHTGGPKALTEWIRLLGDSITRSDRIEPDLNLSSTRDPRDSTTPSNASQLWYKLDTTLLQQARKQWLADLASNQASSDLFDSVLPAGWQIFDRTGAGSSNENATRAWHAIMLTETGARYYAAVHVRSPAKTELAHRDETLRQVFRILTRVINSKVSKH